tara:strand:+ start:73 stop:360 length:288 start_codon:yes stop_codon:yes gene_type:complete
MCPSVTERITASSVEHKKEKNNAKKRNPARGIRSEGPEYVPSLISPPPIDAAETEGIAKHTKINIKILLIMSLTSNKIKNFLRQILFAQCPFGLL